VAAHDPASGGKGDDCTPAMDRNQIARSLQEITGRTFVADKQQWLKWWQEERKQSQELKRHARSRNSSTKASIRLAS
jgi:hypothetical protein